MSLRQDRQPAEASAPFDARRSWKGGARAGLLAAAATGVVISVVGVSTLRQIIPGLYGLAGNRLAGWIVHLVHGALFGALFSAILADPGLYGLSG